MKNYKKGFTLIELLVVIAIIGILSAVVLTSLSTAREKANKAAFKAEVSGLHPSALAYCDGTTSGTVNYSWSNGSKINAGNIACTTSGTLTNTTVTGSISGCTGIVSDSGVTFNGC